MARPARMLTLVAIGKDLGELVTKLKRSRIYAEFHTGALVPASEAEPSLRRPFEDFVLVRTDDGPQATAAIEAMRRHPEAVLFRLANPAPSLLVHPPAETIDRRAHLRQLEASIAATHARLRDASDRGQAISPVGQWLLDNAHALRAQVSDIRASLSPNLLAHVPMAADGLPQVTELARRIVAGLEGTLSESAVVCAAGSGSALLIDEIWLLPTLLRLALVESLAEAGEVVRRRKDIREAALFWANRLTAASRASPEMSPSVLEKMLASPWGPHPEFLVSVAEQLHDEDRVLAAFLAAASERMALPAADLVAGVHQDEARQGVHVASAFASLRALSRIDFVDVFGQVSVVEMCLATDPGGVYPESDEDTRGTARRAVQEMARAAQIPEIEVARAAVAKVSERGGTAHVLEFLIAGGRAELERSLGVQLSLRRRIERGLRHRAPAAYVGTVAFISIALALLALSVTVGLRPGQRWLLLPLGLLALFPLSEFSIQLVNVLVISFFRTSALPKMDYRIGIPDECCTLVAVPMMSTSLATVQHELDKLEIRYLANSGGSVYFSVVSDFGDAAERELPGDADVRQALALGIDSLNRKYPGARFLAFHRPRSWSATEQAWIGRERKRGKLEELNNFLCGASDPAFLLAGTMPPNPVRYVIALDADTQLPPYSARRLVETISHPLNRVELDPVTKVQRRGYAIIQPRVSISLPGAAATRFTRIAGDAHGTDPYCRLVSDSQQDLFGHAIFHGKAIYDVAAMRQCLDGRFPPDTILSHDLIEGAHCGVGLATDVELFENMPLDYASFSRRQHRWIRGDWQIAPWLLPRVPSGQGEAWTPNPLNAINRWRIFDNLRRSLVPPASVALLLAGWFLSPTPAVWTAVLLLAAVIPGLALMLDRVALRLQGSVIHGRGSYDELGRVAMSLVFLPHLAWLSLDAIGRALYRMLISRRNLLEWQTAESTGQAATSHRAAALRQLTILSGLSGAVAVWQATMHRGSAMPLLVLWAAAPLLLQWLSRPAGHDDLADELDTSERDRLWQLARRTWRFFDDHVGPSSNWLPPDNSQLALNIEVANRTSPTNVGLWLNSAQAANDLGFLSWPELLVRAGHTISTLERMEKYEGHLFNWYRIDTLTPLPPRYVSTVDSGNLLASWWVLQQGCREMADRQPLQIGQIWKGMAATCALLREAAGRQASAAFELRALRRLLSHAPEAADFPAKLRTVASLADRARGVIGSADPESRYWAEHFSRETLAWVAVLDEYYSWLDVLARVPDSTLRRLGSDWPMRRREALNWDPTLAQLGADLNPVAALQARRDAAGIDPELSSWLGELHAEFGKAQRRARSALRAWTDLSERINRLAQATNMAALFDPQRKLFAIGHAVGTVPEMTSHYDLLASECRLASLVSIASGDVPIEHWSSLGRTRTLSPSGQTLLSWSGTMFEYLMPLLFVRNYPNSLLAHACRDAVDRQIDHGERNKLPWGVSESAHSAIDERGTYQYHAFGVPTLSLRRITASERVVAPYATLLALQVDPRAALENLDRLERAGLSGPMGFYEAIDYTQRPAPDSEEGVVIYCYMAHHQGMSLLAIDNVLCQQPMQRRFHRDFRIRAIESLLFERIPNSPVPPREREESLEQPVAAPAETAPPERAWTEPTPVPRAQFLGNGRLNCMLTNSGGSYARWNGLDLNRWRSDAARDNWGLYLVLRDVKSGALWSATHQPMGGAVGEFRAVFTADRVTYERTAHDVASSLEVMVSAEDDVEIRRLRVVNRSSRPRALDLTSYMELALASHGADRAHPAFSKLFVQTESPERGVLLATRRRRSESEPEVWIGQLLVGPVGAVSFETDREKFLGRGNSLEQAAGFVQSLDNSQGTVVDPVFSMRCRLHLGAEKREEVSLITAVAHSREALLTIIERYRRPQAVPQAFELAWNRTQLDLRFLRIGPDDVHRYQQLGSALMFPDPTLRARAGRLAQDRAGQSALWAAGISGDLPMVTVAIPDARGLPLLRELLLAHTYLSRRGLRFDLIVLNQEPVSYDRPLSQRLHDQTEAFAGLRDQPGGIFVRNWHILAEPLANQLIAASHVFFRGGRGALQYQLTAPVNMPVALPPHPRRIPQDEPSPLLPFLELPYFNGMGGFTPDGSEYAIYLGPGVQTPAPWSNVIAHEGFGTLVTESGLGFTWCGNSQANRLTPWHNDPVSDPQSEVIYLRDEDSGAVWTPTALPVRGAQAYRARHGHGYTAYEHNSHGIGQELTVFVPVDQDGVGAPVKVCRLQLRNHSPRVRTLTATYFAELVLGSEREDQQLRISTEHDVETGAVFATQWWAGAGAGDVAFLAATPKPRSYTGDRLQFLGRNRPIAQPLGLDRQMLDGRTGPGLDPGAAVQVVVTLQPGQTSEIAFLLGQGRSPESCRALIRGFAATESVPKALEATRAWWRARLGTLTVRTPLLSADMLLNRWLLYQSLSCRFWGRSALYQSGGAIGFRDQLQDSLALLYADPALTRSHIMVAAGRQFEEGDVQHWWHPDTGLGVRSRCSDDLLWLPFAVAAYVRFTGDTRILAESVPFLTAPELAVDEREKMFVPAVAHQRGTLLDHCRRAVARSMRFGSHGIPLFGTGDWNDGMNLVGAEGRGESVWLGWFMGTVLHEMAGLLFAAGDPAEAHRCQADATRLASAIEANCWDGAWYVRGYFDDGQPLGSGTNAEAKIDSLPQSWSAISGLGDPARSQQALASARELLMDSAHKLVKLFTPPFDVSRPHPGYIMGYPPGLRENGGQYTHGSLWLAMAFARTGNGTEAVRLLTLMNPIEQTRTPEDVARYCGEPYAVAADVSASPARMGRSGWTWYTGSAAWMYRIWVEEVLGIRIQNGSLLVKPALPEDWSGFAFTWRQGTASYEIDVVVEDGAAQPAAVLLVDDGQVHRLRLTVPRAPPQAQPQAVDSALLVDDLPRRSGALLPEQLPL